MWVAGLRRRLQGPAPVMVMGQASQHNYSTHMSTSLALGFLFMAGGGSTFSTSPQATAALVISLFPRFPHSPTDHRCHLQVKPLHSDSSLPFVKATLKSGMHELSLLVCASHTDVTADTGVRREVQKLSAL